MKKQLFLSVALLIACPSLPAMQPSMNFNGPAKLITNPKGNAQRVLLPDGRTIELDPSKNWVMRNGILQEAGKPAVQVQSKPAAPAVAQAAIRKTTCANGACSVKNPVAPKARCMNGSCNRVKPAAKPVSGCATGTCNIKPMRMTCSNGKCGVKK